MIQNREHVTVSLDKRRDSKTPVITIRQGDVNGTLIEVTVEDDIGIPDLSEAEAWFEMTMPDDQLYRTNPITIESGNTFTIPLDESIAGITTGKYRNAYVRLRKDGNVSSTSSFTVNVIAGSADDAMTIDEYIENRMAQDWEEIYNDRY